MDLTGLNRLGEHVARSEDRWVEPRATDEATRRALAERVAARVGKRRSSAFYARLVPAVIAVGIVIAGSILFALRGSSATALTFDVGSPSRPGVLREWVSAPAAADLPIVFSDGSRVQLLPGSRARVVRTGAKGAELVVESGRAVVEVMPREGAEFRVHTGPFDVEITGTRFTVAWHPERDEFELELEDGHVTVRGCGLGGGVPIRAGQRLEASCNPATFSLRPRGGAAAAAKPEAAPAIQLPSAHSYAPRTPASAARSANSSASASKPSARAAGSPQGATEPGWPELARQGHFGRAYAAAHASGFEAECARAAAADLLLLGDSARLTGHASQAVHAYLTLRRRFAASPAAAQAAFHLGRLEGPQSSARWFETYLREQADGPLAEAALGRLFEAEFRRGEHARARRLANSYLARYPSGAHADSARRLANQGD